MGEDRGRAACLQRDEKGRRDRPGQGGERAKAGTLGQPRGEHPRPECRERQPGEVERDEEQRRLPERQRAEHREHRRERIGRTDEAEPDIPPAVAERAPQLADARGHRQEPATSEDVRPEQREEQGDAEHGGRKDDPGAASAEEVEVAPLAAERDIGGLPLQGAGTPHFGDRDAQGRDRRPADDPVAR